MGLDRKERQEVDPEGVGMGERQETSVEFTDFNIVRVWACMCGCTCMCICAVHMCMSACMHVLRDFVCVCV